MRRACARSSRPHGSGPGGETARYGLACAPATILGLFFFVSAIWDGVVDPVIGTLIDRKRAGGIEHWQWMLRSAVPLGLLVAAIIFLPAALPGFVLLIALLMLYSAYSLYDVAHAAWGAGLGATETETVRIFGAREFWAKISLILAFGLPAALQVLDPGVSLFDRIAAYSWLAILTIPIALLASRGLSAARPVAGLSDAHIFLPDQTSVFLRYSRRRHPRWPQAIWGPISEPLSRRMLQTGICLIFRVLFHTVKKLTSCTCGFFQRWALRPAALVEGDTSWEFRKFFTTSHAENQQ
jgi:Na+/melibiose symporter-like transporter